MLVGRVASVPAWRAAFRHVPLDVRPFERYEPPVRHRDSITSGHRACEAIFAVLRG
jgi:hypothetical protein